MQLFASKLASQEDEARPHHCTIKDPVIFSQVNLLPDDCVDDLMYFSWGKCRKAWVPISGSNHQNELFLCAMMIEIRPSPCETCSLHRMDSVIPRSAFPSCFYHIWCPQTRCAEDIDDLSRNWREVLALLGHKMNLGPSRLFSFQLLLKKQLVWKKNRQCNASRKPNSICTI